MAEEPGTLGGRTPGPGSARGGAASAAAASRIRVDTSDVTKLKTAIKQTQVEAKALSDTLGAFDSKVLPTIRKVRAELEGLQRALGTSGTRSATGPKATPIGGGVGSANQHAGQMSGGAVNVGRGGSYLPGPAGSAYASAFFGNGPQGGGDPYVSVHPSWGQPYSPGRIQRAASYLVTPQPSGTAPFKPPAWSTTPAFRGAMGALGAAASVGSLAAGHLDDATSRSYLINTTQLLTGGSTGNRAQFAFNRGLTAAMGNSGLGYGDVTSALGTLATTGVMGGSYGASRMASVGFLSNINPMQGNAASAQQVGQTFTSQNYYRMRLAGVNASIANGQNIQQVFDGIIRRIEQASGHPLTSEEIQSGLQQGTHLNADLTAMGLSQDMVQQIVQYWAARRATGKTGVAAVRGSGAQNNLAYQRQRAGAARSRAGEKIDTGYIPGASQASRVLGHEYNALGAAADTSVGHALSDAAGNLAVFSDQLKKATSVIKTIVEWEIASRLLGGGKGFPGLPGRSRPPGTPRAGGKLIPALTKVAAGVAVLDFARHAEQSTPKVKKNDWGWDRWTAPAKGAWGGVKGLVSDLNPFGGSNQDPSIWGGSGQTFKTLEQMASGGPREIVTSTTGGQHAQGSYHYKGQAIDLADKAGSHDSPGLLAINQYLAKKYGHKLAELIYAGPGGTNIKNGKVVNGMATYGAATMAEHHNHVHVAATPGSLGMSGGVDVGSGDPAQAASSSGGFARPGGPSGGPSVNNASSALGSIFTTSSSDALMAALMGSFAGGASALTSGRSGGSSPRTASAGAGRVPAAPSNVKGNVAMAKRMAAQRGWTGKEWDALYAVWNQESGFRTNAGSVGAAYGIPQALPGSKMSSAGSDWQTNPATQIKWGLGYIGGRYHDPLGALAHKHATDSRLGSHAPLSQPGGWYAKGQFEIFRDELARLHKGEMVIPAQEAAQIRSIVGASRSSGASSGGGTRKTVPVQLVFHVQGGGEAEARKHAAQFAQFVAEDHGIDMVASG